MRNRPIQMLVYFNEKEYEHLLKLSAETKISKSNLLRYLALGFKPKAVPDFDYRKIIRELRRIGNNINQLVKLTYLNGFLNPKELQQHLDELTKIEDNLNEAFEFDRGY